ncbi:MAG: glycosyltransferase family 4 protein [Candidatus Limnocylindria bacterium]
MPEQAPLHVAMLVRNPYTHDSRVEKEAGTLRDAGYRVTVIADAGPGLPVADMVDGIAVVRVPRALGGMPGIRYATHDVRLAKVLAGLRPAILHAHDSNALLPVGLAASGLHVPFVYDAHELWLHRPRRGHHRMYHDASRAYYAALQQWMVPRASAILTVSAPIQRHLERVYRAPVDLVPNYPVLGAPAVAGPLRTRLGAGVPERSPIVLHLGGMMATRGLEELVTAIRDVAEAHLVFLGGGDSAPLLRLARQLGIAKRIHILSPVPPGDVEAYAAAADIGVVTTQPIGLNNRYSLANKLFQYMAAGIAVLASDFPQVRAVVVGSGAGLVADTRRPEAIAVALNDLLGDRAALRAMGERGRKAIEERYNWSTSAAALLAAYARVVSGAGPR